MKTTVLKLILFVFLPVCLFSCSSDDEKSPEEDKNYVFSSIMWRLEEGDGAEEVIVNIPEEVVTNTGNTTKKVTFKSVDWVKETSEFEYEDAEKFNNFFGSEIMVSVPTEYRILSSKYGYYTGRKAPLVADEEFVMDPETKIEDTLDLPPNTKITYSGSIKYNKVRASYLIRLEEENNSFDYIEITGKWTGLVFSNMEKSIVASEIK